MKRTPAVPKTQLVRVGKHLINPDEVAAIKRASEDKRLYIIVLKNQTPSDFPIWATGSELEGLLQKFEIVDND